MVESAAMQKQSSGSSGDNDTDEKVAINTPMQGQNALSAADY